MNALNIANKEVKSNKLSDQCFDKKYSGVIISSGNILVTELNMPSSQVLQNFSLKIMQLKQKLEENR